MKKIIKEVNRTILLIDAVLYLIYTAIGFLLLKYPEIEVLKPIEYTSYIFYILGFFSLLAYFVNRRRNDYEFLFLGLINIVVGSFIFLCPIKSAYTGTILGTSVLIYSIAMAFNKAYHSIRMSRDNNINYFPKVAITLLLSVLGLLVIMNLFKNTTMQTLILGYYFMCFGVISLIEPIIRTIMKNKKIKKYLNELIEDRKNDSTGLKEVKTSRLSNKY